MFTNGGVFSTPCLSTGLHFSTPNICNPRWLLSLTFLLIPRKYGLESHLGPKQVSYLLVDLQPHSPSHSDQLSPKSNLCDGVAPQHGGTSLNRSSYHTLKLI